MNFRVFSRSGDGRLLRLPVLPGARSLRRSTGRVRCARRLRRSGQRLRSCRIQRRVALELRPRASWPRCSRTTSILIFPRSRSNSVSQELAPPSRSPTPRPWTWTIGILQISKGNRSFLHTRLLIPSNTNTSISPVAATFVASDR